MAKKKQTGNTRILRISKYKTKFTYTKTQLFAENKGFCVKCGAVKPGPRLTPKRKVVGSNPARNADFKGGDRKDWFPLLSSQKTISVKKPFMKPTVFLS